MRNFSTSSWKTIETQNLHSNILKKNLDNYLLMKLVLHIPTKKDWIQKTIWVSHRPWSKEIDPFRAKAPLHFMGSETKFREIFFLMLHIHGHFFEKPIWLSYKPQSKETNSIKAKVPLCSVGSEMKFQENIFMKIIKHP